MNVQMSRARVSVEHAIGNVCNLFPALDYKREEKMGITPIALKYTVACIMRNFITVVRGSNQISDFFDCPPPSINEYFSNRDRLQDL